MAAERDSAKFKIFVSYSRAQAAAADELVAALEARGFDVKIDRRHLEFGRKWQDELAEFIRLSDSVIWLISENSVASKWVNWELDEVARRNKRLVPIMVVETARDQLPRQLGEVHILPAQGEFDLARDLDALVRVLETDFEWLKEGSRLADRAHEWLLRQRTSAWLLSGAALSTAERWKQNRPKSAPPPAPAVLDLLHASRQAATKRQKWTVLASLLFAGFAIGVATFALHQRGQALAERNAALISNSRVLAGRSQQILDRMNSVKALLVALEALPSQQPGERPYTWQAERAAFAALQASQQTRKISSIPRQKGWGDWRPLLSHDGQVLFGEIEFPIKENTAAIWSVKDGSEIARFKAGVDRDRVARIDERRQHILVAPDNEQPQLIELATMARKTLSELSPMIFSQFSASGERIATLHKDGYVRLWSVPAAKLLQTFDAKATEVSSMSLSDDGEWLAVGRSEIEVLVFQRNREEAVCRIDLGEKQPAHNLSFAASNTVLITANVHNPFVKIEGEPTARFWSLASCEQWTLDAGKGDRPISAIHQLRSPDRVVVSWSDARSHAVSRRGSLVVVDPATKEVLHAVDRVVDYAVFEDNVVMLQKAADSEGRIVIVDLGGKRAELELLEGKSRLDVPKTRFDLDDIRFNKQATRLVARTDVLATPQLWDAQTGRRIAVLEWDGVRVLPLTFSPDGQRLVAVDTSGRFYVWNAIKGSLDAIFDVGKTDPTAEFSPTGRRITVTAADRSSLILDMNIDNRLEGGEELFEARFIDGGARVFASGSADVVWDASARQLLQLPADELLKVSMGVSDKIMNREWFSVMARPGATMKVADESVPAPKKSSSEVLAADVADETMEGIKRSEMKAAAQKHGVSDLVFLVEAGDRKDPLIWLIGNDGRISVQPASSPQDRQRPANGRSLSQEMSTIPESHQPYFGTKIHDVAFSADGMSMLLTAEMDGFDGMRLYQIDGRKEVRFVAEQAAVEGVRIQNSAFSPSNGRIVVAMETGLQVLDGSTLEPVADIPLPSRSALSFDISDDGRRMLTLQDGEVRLWDLHPNAQTLVEHARRSVPRCLTRSERVNELQLDPTPPLWCVERRLWPYQNDDWQAWLLQRKAWLAAGLFRDEPALPNAE